MYRLLILILCLLCCENNETSYKTVDLNKTQKIKVQGDWKSQHTISYLWPKVDGPENHNSSRIIKGNTMLFTPGMIGEYIITVSIENSMGEILGEEKFYYSVVNNDGKNNIKNMPSSLIDVNNKVDANINELKNAGQNSGYTIQIASWDKFEDALKNRDYLTQNSFDAYIKEFIVNEKTWYRVRVGKNLSYNRCIKLMAELKKVATNNIWIDKF